MITPKVHIPDEVAAYAAALHDAGFGTWGEVAGRLRIIGMGALPFRELAAAATAWARKNVPTEVRRRIRRLASKMKEQRGGALLDHQDRDSTAKHYTSPADRKGGTTK